MYILCLCIKIKSGYVCIDKLQVLQKRLYEVQKSTETLSGRLDKAREENDDLRFQVTNPLSYSIAQQMVRKVCIQMSKELSQQAKYFYNNVSPRSS